MEWLNNVVNVFIGNVLEFVSKLFWYHKNQKLERERQEKEQEKEDESLLGEICNILLEITRAGRRSLQGRPTINCMDELSKFSMEIKRKENETIKLDIYNFSKKYRDSSAILTQESREMRKEV
jgi:hypothetical protein